MNLFLCRHAIAAASSLTTDRLRPLTPEGERKFRRAARGFLRLKPEIELILCSPLLRARQTAEILAEEIDSLSRRPVHLDTIDYLAPPGRLDALLSHLAGLKAVEGVVAVGHEPILSDWIGQLCFGQVGRCELKKGGIALIRLDSSCKQGFLEFLMQAGQLRKLV